MIPISKEILEPRPTTNILFVDSLEDFEKIVIELKPNESKLAFDNFKQCFYIGGCDKLGVLQPIKIYFYEDFAQKIKDVEREEFEKKCREAGLDTLKTEMACKFFLEHQKPYDVWLWVTSEKKKDYSWDYVIYLKCSFKKKLFKHIV